MAYFVQALPDDEQIIVNVHVSTGAEATTTLFMAGPDNVWKSLLSSPHGDGMIPETPIGSGNSLIGHTLKIKTLLELELIPENLRQPMIDNLKITYHFKGAITEAISFEYAASDKKTSTDKLWAIVTSIIQLIAPLTFQ